MNLKNRIKEKLNYYPKLNIKKLKNEIDKYSYISFDIFDTLIKRDVASPKDVFKLMGRELGNDSFCTDRLNAEKMTRETTTNEEISLKDIYHVLEKEMHYKNIEKIMDLEVEIEKNVCTKNIELYEIYQYCLEKKKKIIITSNMYLSIDVITDILKSNGYDKYDKIYLSCEVGKKKNKTLFQYVLNDLEIDARELLHIGDSYKNDYKGAKKYHIHTYLIPKKMDKILHKEENHVLEKDKFFIKQHNSFVSNRLDLEKDPYFNFGYESFGLLLYEFNLHMHEDLKRKGIKDIFFFSRDGFIIKNVYDEIFPDDEIKSHYIYVSRRSLRVPQLWTNPELEVVVKTFPLAKLLTMETFIKNLGLEPEKYKEILKKHHLSLDTNIEKRDILKTEDVVSFYEDIKEDVIQHSKDECELLLDYFKQEGFKGKAAIVDIGWHGSLQYFIQILAKEVHYDLNMEGYYIGLAKEAREGIQSHGFVVDMNSETKSCDSWKAFNGLVETLFLAQEGSTEKFARKGNRVVPVLYPYEYDDKDGNKEIEALKVKALQEGAVCFAKDFKNSVLAKIAINSSTAYRKILLTGLYPNKKDLGMFSDFRFLEEQIEYLAMPRSLFFYITHVKALKKDLFLCRWKIGFLKKLFKIKLPYNKMYKLLRKISG